MVIASGLSRGAQAEDQENIDDVRSGDVRDRERSVAALGRLDAHRQFRRAGAHRHDRESEHDGGTPIRVASRTPLRVFSSAPAISASKPSANQPIAANVLIRGQSSRHASGPRTANASHGHGAAPVRPQHDQVGIAIAHIRAYQILPPAALDQKMEPAPLLCWNGDRVEKGVQIAGEFLAKSFS